MVTWQPPTILVVANFTQASNTLNFFRKSFFLFFQIRLTVFTQLCLSNHWNPLSYMISEMATRWLIYLVLFFWTFLHWNVVKTCKSCLNLIVAPLWCGPNNISPQTIQMATIKKHCCRQETLSAQIQQQQQHTAARLRSHIQSVWEEISGGYFYRLKWGCKLNYISSADEMKIKMFLLDKTVVQVIHVQKYEGQERRLNQ